MTRTPQGGLRIPAYATRTGVFDYLQPDGSVRREYRPPEEVFADGSLASLRHAPVTDKHPEENGARVVITPENYRTYARGHVAEDVHADGDFVASTLLIQDADLIEKIEAGERRELSCGYTCDLDYTPGMTEKGEAYDVIQRKISHNHVALGPQGWGRAGGAVQLRLDSNEAFQTEEHSMKEFIDGKEYTVGAPEWVAALKASLDAALRRADAADPQRIAELVARRAKLLSDCERLARRAKKHFDAAGAASIDEGGLLTKAIQQIHPDFDPAGRSADNIAGYFECLIRDLGGEEEEDEEPTDDSPDSEKSEMQGVPAKQKPEPTAPMARTDSPVFSARRGTRLSTAANAEPAPDPDKARLAMVHENQNAWRASK